MTNGSGGCIAGVMNKCIPIIILAVALQSRVIPTLRSQGGIFREIFEPPCGRIAGAMIERLIHKYFSAQRHKKAASEFQRRLFIHAEFIIP